MTRCSRAGSRAAASGRCAATQGHGFDPMFQPDGYEVTLGEMDRWAKNRISHRGDAFARMAAACLG